MTGNLSVKDDRILGPFLTRGPVFDGTPAHVHLHRVFASLSGVCFSSQARFAVLGGKTTRVTNLATLLVTIAAVV
jgi:hypothetical protein